MLTEFNAFTLNNLCNVYELTPMEIMCIILNWSINNKTLSFSYTVGSQSKSKNKEILAGQFFRREQVQKFIKDQKNNFIVNTFDEKRESENVSDVESTLKDKVIKENESISGDNIKELLEREYQKTTDPEKRTVLLIKIADFIGLKNSNEDDPLQPQIYLPARCQTCPKYVQTNDSKTNNL